MKCVFVSVLVLATIALSYGAIMLHPLSDEFIDFINSKKSTWKAGRNFAKTTPLVDLKKLMGVLPKTATTPELPIKAYSANLFDIPESFDAREAWPECASIIGDIRDQGNCGSCWAFGAAEAISDRICIHSNATVKVSISAEDFNTCCHVCGFGCVGGWPQVAWSYWQAVGVVTGGKYGTTDGCKAYSVAPCDHHVKDSYEACGPLHDTPTCVLSCDSESSLNYDADLRTGSAHTVPAVEDQMQIEIMTNGPVQAAFYVFEDFLAYKSGVYQHLAGAEAGGHAVKILGWGVENDTPYWLVANSWNEEWGDKGYFKILRGSNECEIESNISGGIPKF